MAPKAPRKGASGPRRFALVPDTHAPFQDERAWACAMNALAGWRPHTIVHLGDLVDFHAISFHEREAGVPLDLQWELDEAARCLKDMTSVGANERFITLGNHEHRWDRALNSGTAKDFRTLRSLKLDEQLGFTRLGWKQVPFREGFYLGKTYITHELDRFGRRAHEQAIADVMGPVFIGHVHGMGDHYAQTVRGGGLFGSASGWLGRYESIKYRHRARAMREWVQGVRVGYIESDGTMHHWPVPIHDRTRCIIEGKVYRA